MTDVARDVPPPLQHVPSSKEKRYDRQLRLWGATGQQALEESHILLINFGPGVTGVETLKNLVLPGVGQFTIQDPSIVSETDLGVNFFLEEKSLGSYRAAECCRLLEELNPDVKSHSITEPLASWISKPDILKEFTLILVTSPIDLDTLALITNYAQTHLIPVVYIHSVGFYSQFSVALPPAFPIVDTHPDPASTTDLRLLKPWPKLVKFAIEKTFEISSMSAHELGHVPYVLLLLHLIGEWKKSHNGNAPTSYKEKTDFREFVRKAGPPDEENFSEAAAAVLKSLNPPTASSSVLAVLNAPEAQNLNSHSQSFWFIARAVYQFYQEHGELPLPGAVPDMKAQSADYITLQNIYKAKSKEDAAQVAHIVKDLEMQHQRPDALRTPMAEIESFCKGAAHIKLVRGQSTPLFQACDPLKWNAESAKSLYSAIEQAAIMPDSSALIYIAFLAYDKFVATHNQGSFGSEPRVPGSNDMEVDTDGDKVTATACTILDAAITASGSFLENPMYDETKESLEKICREIVRAGGSELHNIASLSGGMVSQEVIKIITRQYVPVDNTCVFDGVASRTGVIRI